jgi:hypothetical protein
MTLELLLPCDKAFTSGHRSFTCVIGLAGDGTCKGNM